MMSLLQSDTCRLCRSTEFLKDLNDSNEVNSDMTLDLKINYCIGLKVQLGDGLPSTICKTCIDNIDRFCKFKQKCLEMDLKFKAIKNSTTLSTLNDNTNGEIFAQYDSETHGCMTETSRFTDLQNMKNNGNNDTKINMHMDITVQKKQSNKLNNLIYQCELCGRLFKMKTVLDQHLMIHSGTKPFACQICNKTFARAENRKIHMRSHMGIKPYICEICGVSSTKHQDLIRHMKIHSDERKYSCPRCNRSFKRSSDVTSHMRTHTGLRPYSCRTCPKTYTSHNGLRKHYKKYCRDLRIVT